MVRLGARSTHLHRIVIVYRGVEMVVCKELKKWMIMAVFVLTARATGAQRLVC